MCFMDDNVQLAHDILHGFRNLIEKKFSVAVNKILETYLSQTQLLPESVLVTLNVQNFPCVKE